MQQSNNTKVKIEEAVWTSLFLTFLIAHVVWGLLGSASFGCAFLGQGSWKINHCYSTALQLGFDLEPAVKPGIRE